MTLEEHVRSDADAPDAANGGASHGGAASKPATAAAGALARGAASGLFRGLRHLLGQNEWARQKLAMFAGRRVRLGVDAPRFAAWAGPRLTARITDDGMLEEIRAEPDTAVDAEMLLRPSPGAAFALLRADPRALSSHLRIEGEVMLAAAIGEVVGQLHWDVEEDLSRVTGDVVARRIGRGVASMRDTMRDIRSRIESSTGLHLAGHAGQLVVRTELASMRTQIDSLEERLGRLETPGARSTPGSRTGAGAQAAPEESQASLLPQLRPPLELPRFEIEPRGPDVPGGTGEPG